jgi:type I restriction enzyme S subunit
MSAVKSERYAAYKDSGAEWMGDIPEHWRFVRVKNLISKITSGVTPRGGAESYADVGIPFLRSQNVHNDGLRLDDVSFISESTHQEMINSQVKPGDIVFNITGASIARTCIVPETVKTANISQHVALLRLSTLNEKKFISYYLQSQLVKDYVYLTQSGASKEAFNHGQMKCIPVSLPPRPEQIAIAAYLDTKTAQIDRQIDLLGQKATQYGKLKQSLINETVTRGLDKSVPMKDSGVAWIREVPKHWEIKRGKDIFEQTKNKAGLDSSLYDVLSLTLNGVIKRDLDNMKGKIPASFDGYQIANPGDLVLCLFDIDVTPRIVGYVNNLGIITSAYTVIKGKRKLDMKYFLYYYLEQNRNGSLLANSKTLRSTMTFDLFSQLLLPVPPLEEQRAIASYLDEKTAQIDRIFTAISTQIDKLKDLRKALINDVVTGKMKVVRDGFTV